MSITVKDLAEAVKSCRHSSISEAGEGWVCGLCGARSGEDRQTWRLPILVRALLRMTLLCLAACGGKLAPEATQPDHDPCYVCLETCLEINPAWVDCGAVCAEVCK